MSMLFVTLLVITPERNREAYEAIKKLRTPKGVRLNTFYGLFGRYDALLVYEAASENAAMNFLLNLCKVEGVVDSETFVAISP